jgi:hypothetical protein
MSKPTTMPLPKFWATVAEFGWGTETTDYRAISCVLTANPQEQEPPWVPRHSVRGGVQLLRRVGGASSQRSGADAR